jgi:serine/threonine protein kinase
MQAEEIAVAEQPCNQLYKLSMTTTSSYQLSEAKNCVSIGFRGLTGLLGAVQVYRALKSGVQVVAAKVFQDRDPNSSGSLLSSSKASTARLDIFKQEIAILKSCHDRNIVQFIGACLQPDCTIMVMEYLEGGDLYHAIANDSTGRFSWYRR